MWSSNLNNEAV